MSTVQRPTRRQVLRAATVLAAGALVLGRLPRALAAMPAPLRHTDAEWRKMLSPAQYDVLRQAGTEMPFSSPLDHVYDKGRYACAGCGLHNFSSDTKFDSGTGWPSFWQPVADSVAERKDGSMLMQRTEVRCARCDGHLGHVFDDGPKPTGLRYCMNGVALRFDPAPGAQPPHGA